MRNKYRVHVMMGTEADWIIWQKEQKQASMYNKMQMKLV